MATIKRHNELRVYKLFFEVGMEIFKITYKFSKKEKYSLTDQIRRSSRSVSADIAEIWRKPGFGWNILYNVSI